MFEKPDQGTAYFGGVRVDQLCEMTDLETVRGHQEPIEIALFRFFVLNVPFPDQIPYDSGCRVVHTVEPLHADALASIAEMGGVVTFIMGKVATFGIVFR